MTALTELQKAVLMTDRPDYGLWAGDIGTVVAVWGGGAGYEVEFVRGDGSTIAVLSLSKDGVRAMNRADILGVRIARSSSSTS